MTILSPLGFTEREMRDRLEETGNWDGDGALKLDSGRFVSVPEAMILFDVSPILKRFGTWAVTEYGIECLTSSYAIPSDRLSEPDWLPHVGHKTWVVYEDFRDAYYFARKYFKTQRVPRPVVPEPQTIPGAERRPRVWKQKVSNRVRFLVLKRDKYACQLCGKTAASGALLEIDHRVARKNGGSNDIENLWVLCSTCNSGKGTHDL